MTSTRPPTAQPDKLVTRSSVFQKLDAETRRRVNLAIAERDPPSTYAAIYERFNLAGEGVSFTAFYYYARRIRYHSALIEISGLRPADAAMQPPHAINELVMHRMIGLLLNNELSPREIERLAIAYRITSQTRPIFDFPSDAAEQLGEAQVEAAEFEQSQQPEPFDKHLLDDLLDPIAPEPNSGIGRGSAEVDNQPVSEGMESLQTQGDS